jgi:GxxExxY protein
MTLGPRMHTNAHELDQATDLDVIVRTVIGAAYEVANVLGAGFLEKIYERAMERELALRGLSATSQVRSRSSTKDSTWASMLPIWSLRTGSSLN